MSLYNTKTKHKKRTFNLPNAYWNTLMQTDRIGKIENGGVPNVTGWFGYVSTVTYSAALSAGDACQVDTRLSGNWSGGGGQPNSTGMISFDLSRKNSAYHRTDNQVIPKHIGVNMCIKY